MTSNLDNLSGVGFRHPHFHDLRDSDWDISWIEVISENYVGNIGPRLDRLMQLSEKYQIALHGVSLNLASQDEINMDYLTQLKQLIELVNPVRVSDHLCWTGVHGVNFHDLLPFPYTKEMVDFVADKIKLAQDFLGRQLIVENLSAYMKFAESQMSEYEFANQVAYKAESRLLLDVNNIFVNVKNFGFDLEKIKSEIDLSLVAQIHLAGHIDEGDFLVDTHSAPVCDEVWEIFEWVKAGQNNIPFCIEWDDDIPEFEVLYQEIKKAQKLA